MPVVHSGTVDAGSRGQAGPRGDRAGVGISGALRGGGTPSSSQGSWRPAALTSSCSGGGLGGSLGLGSLGFCDGQAKCAFVETSPSMAFVGTQQGEYTMEMTYKHVGNGSGEFNVVSEKTYNWGMLVGAVVAVAVLSLVVVLVVFAAAPPTTTSRLMSSAYSDYDCIPGLANSMFEWSPDQKAWCCGARGAGCASTAARSPSAAASRGGTLLMSSASGARGAVQPVPAHTPYPQPTALPPPPPPSAEIAQYDCSADFDNWAAGWSLGKQAWCCKQVGKGCPVPGAEGSFDCSTDLGVWRSAWSAPKQGWCCHYEGKGCA